MAAKISDVAYHVDTTSRLAQWRIDGLSHCTYRKSDPFKIGLWNWYLTVEKSKQVVIRLYPETSILTRDRPPIASFVMRVVCSSGNRTTLLHPGVVDKQLKNNEDFIWTIDTAIAGKFLIDVEFLDLKTTSSKASEPCSIWSPNYIETQSTMTALAALRQMLTDTTHTDITITTANGAIRAHRAVLAARSPVFHTMFSHNLLETQRSSVYIPDMSSEVCMAFLAFLYGAATADEFKAHRLALVRAADKYDVTALKEACEESLVEDIDAANVLERLQCAHLYKLGRLKRSCFRYLVGFGKVYEIKEEFDGFLRWSDRELVWEVFNEILAAWKGF